MNKQPPAEVLRAGYRRRMPGDRVILAGMILLGLCVGCLLRFRATPWIMPASSAPLVVLVEKNPWLMAIGSDSPTFALYSSGMVIYGAPGVVQRRPGESPYVAVRLNREEQRRLISELDLNGLLKLSDNYEMTSATDQPDNLLYLSTWLGSKEIDVYGNLRAGPGPRSGVPVPLSEALDRLIGYRNARARPWLPPKVEVMVWDWSDATGAPARWPLGWPDLKSPYAISRPGGLHSVFVSSTHFAEVEELARRLGGRTALLMNGRKWTMSYRIPFPGEQQWMR